jgi:hypothetical protein
LDGRAAARLDAATIVPIAAVPTARLLMSMNFAPSAVALLEMSGADALDPTLVDIDA